MKITKGATMIILSSILILSLAAIGSAGMFDWFGKITGRVTQQSVNVNVTITNTAPTLVSVSPISAVNLNEGPVNTVVSLSFVASDADGAGNLNDSSARVNFTRSGESVRLNYSCLNVGSTVSTVNYTCNVPMYWYDAAGSWTVTVSVYDWDFAVASNSTTTFTVNSLTGFVSAPPALTWPSITPGITNQTSNNDPILLNNTGNQNISAGNVQLNATNLRGEIDSNKALFANNFSVGPSTGGTPPVECGATTMSPSAYTGITGASLPRGNFTINDKSTGQEEIYFCIKKAGSELTAQAYSTKNEGAWTIKIS
jgi:hypothetical protein